MSIRMGGENSVPMFQMDAQGEVRVMCATCGTPKVNLVKVFALAGEDCKPGMVEIYGLPVGDKNIKGWREPAMAIEFQCVPQKHYFYMKLQEEKDNVLVIPVLPR